MKVVIRHANLQSDRQLIIDTARRFLTPRSDDCRFSWLYESNAHGRARVWFAHSADDGEIVGMAGAFPRRIYIENREETAWVLGDFCINDRYRSLGPALALQRACLVEVDAGAVAFCYDFPSKSMMAVYKRLQILPFAHILRLAKPLRVDRRLKKLVKSQTFNRVLGVASNFVLKHTEKTFRGDGALDVSLHAGDYGGEFSDLARRIGGRYGVCAQRSAEYLNWRFVKNPLHQYELITARRGGALLGYAVFLHEGEDAMLVDLFGVDDEAVVNAVMAQCIALMRTRGVQTVSAALIETHPWRLLLERHGFKVREVSPMVIYVPSNSASGAAIIREPKWLFMHGDRDS